MAASWGFPEPEFQDWSLVIGHLALVIDRAATLKNESEMTSDQ
jgi:hypothetical protein